MPRTAYECLTSFSLTILNEGRKLTLDCANCPKYSLTHEEKKKKIKIAIEELTHS